MPNDGSDPARRVAGVIMWYLQKKDPRTGERYDAVSAVAQAALRQKDASDDLLRYALRWAEAALRFQELAQEHCGVCKVTGNDKDGYRACPDPEKKGGWTIKRLLDESGMSQFLERYREDV